MASLCRNLLRLSRPALTRPALAFHTSRALSTVLVRKAFDITQHKVPSNITQVRQESNKNVNAHWTTDEVLERIIDVLQCHEKLVGRDDLHLDLKLKEDLGLDSLDLVELVLHLEDSTLVYISDDEMDTMETVRDIWEVMLHKLMYKWA